MVVMGMAEKGGEPDQRQCADHQMRHVMAQMFRPLVTVRAEFVAQPRMHRLPARVPFARASDGAIGAFVRATGGRLQVVAVTAALPVCRLAARPRRRENPRRHLRQFCP